MDARENWSSKYPEEGEVLRDPDSLDAYVAATQAKGNARSAHAWVIYRGSPFEVSIPIQTRASDGESTQERGCLSAIVRILQRCAPRSDVRIFCRLENVVKAMRGLNELIVNSDILEEIESLRQTKFLKIEAVRCSTADKTGSRIIERLLAAARKERDRSSQG